MSGKNFPLPTYESPAFQALLACVELLRDMANEEPLNLQKELDGLYETHPLVKSIMSVVAKEDWQ